jgi:hypothetical protein
VCLALFLLYLKVNWLWNLFLIIRKIWVYICLFRVGQIVAILVELLFFFEIFRIIYCVHWVNLVSALNSFFQKFVNSKYDPFEMFLLLEFLKDLPMLFPYSFRTLGGWSYLVFPHQFSCMISEICFSFFLILLSFSNPSPYQ